MIKIGLDIYIYKAKNRRVFKTEGWYNSDKVTEVYYARKFWALIQEASFINVERDCGEFIRLTRENVEELLDIATHNKDYFDGFSTVPALCTILQKFEQIEDEGYHYYMEFDY